MGGRQQQKLTEGAASYLEPGEQVLCALVAQARGVSRAKGGAVIGGIAGAAVGGLMGKAPAQAHAAADDAGLEIRSPMGLALTDRRLMTLEIDGMSRGTVKSFLSAVPLDAVDGIDAKSVGLSGAKIVLTVRGSTVDLECASRSESKELAASFQGTRSA
jgi:hypothetical protein